jgi:hypothetical protein
MDDELRELHRTLLQEAIRSKLTPGARRRPAQGLGRPAPPAPKRSSTRSAGA